MDFGLAVGQFALHGEPATDCIHGAVELDKQPVAHAADYVAAILGDLRLDRAFDEICQPKMRVFFIKTHQPAVTDDICEKNGGEPTFQVGVFHADRLTVAKYNEFY
jgi:hypothetical protein